MVKEIRRGLLKKAGNDRTYARAIDAAWPRKLQLDRHRDLRRMVGAGKGRQDPVTASGNSWLGLGTDLYHKKEDPSNASYRVCRNPSRQPFLAS